MIEASVHKTYRVIVTTEYEVRASSIHAALTIVQANPDLASLRNLAVAEEKVDD